MPRTCVGQLPIIQEEYDVVPSRPLDPKTERRTVNVSPQDQMEEEGSTNSSKRACESVLGSNGAKQTSAEIDASPRDTHTDTIVNLCYYGSVAVLMSPLRLVSNTLYIASLFAWCSSGI